MWLDTAKDDIKFRDQVEAWSVGTIVAGWFIPGILVEGVGLAGFGLSKVADKPIYRRHNKILDIMLRHNIKRIKPEPHDDIVSEAIDKMQNRSFDNIA